MAITDPQIVPSTLASDLDIISFTVEHYPGDALGIATAAPRMTWVCSGMLPIDAQILLKVTRRVPGGQPVEERTYLPLTLPCLFHGSSRRSPHAKKCSPPCRPFRQVTSHWANRAQPCISKSDYWKNMSMSPISSDHRGANPKLTIVTCH